MERMFAAAADGAVDGSAARSALFLHESTTGARRMWTGKASY
jgi:hypothetical protein